MFNKKAFTLAEILITLGVIGIVSALTIPSLMHAYKKHLIETRLKYTVSVLSNLARQVQEEEGSFQSIYQRTADDGNLNNRSVAFHEVLLKYIKAYPCSSIKSYGYRISQRQCMVTASRNFSNWQGIVAGEKLVLPNGIGFSFYNQNTTGNIPVDVDLGISSHKMIYGVDYFKLILVPDGQIKAVNKDGSGWHFKCNSKFRGSDSKVITNVRERCEDTGRDDYQGYYSTYCAALIECNGWKIPKDYPIKF